MLSTRTPRERVALAQLVHVDHDEALVGDALRRHAGRAAAAAMVAGAAASVLVERHAVGGTARTWLRGAAAARGRREVLRIWCSAARRGAASGRRRRGAFTALAGCGHRRRRGRARSSGTGGRWRCGRRCAHGCRHRGGGLRRGKRGHRHAAGGCRSSSQPTSARLRPNRSAIASAQGGSALRGGATFTSKSAGPPGAGGRSRISSARRG